MKLDIKRELAYLYREAIKDLAFFGTWAFIALVIVLLLIMRQYSFAVKYAVAIFISVLVEIVIKALHRENRPDYRSVKPKSLYADFEEKHTFPSGHSQKIAVFTTMAHLQYHLLPITLLFITISLLVGLSRIGLKRHYFKDVVGGYLMGVIVGLAVSIA